MKDFIGQELSIGDSVILIAPGYRSFAIGKIFAFTAMQVRVEYNNTWNYGRDGHIQQILQPPSQLVKVSPQ